MKTVILKGYRALATAIILDAVNAKDKTFFESKWFEFLHSLAINPPSLEDIRSVVFNNANFSKTKVSDFMQQTTLTLDEVLYGCDVCNIKVRGKDSIDNMCISSRCVTRLKKWCDHFGTDKAKTRRIYINVASIARKYKVSRAKVKKLIKEMCINVEEENLSATCGRILKTDAEKVSKKIEQGAIK